MNADDAGEGDDAAMANMVDAGEAHGQPVSDGVLEEMLGEDGPSWRDPAEALAELMLADALGASGLSEDAARSPGAVILVVVPSAEWVQPTRAAWVGRISGKAATRAAEGARDWPTVKGSTTMFTPTGVPDEWSTERCDEAFQHGLSHRTTMVGICSNLEWLPPDLVSAADHRLTVVPPKPETISQLARRLTGSETTIGVPVDEALACTPRLARLAARPEQGRRRGLMYQLPPQV